jgi:hypothetical protein
VTEEKGYSYFGENKFFDEKSGLLNSYTPEMRNMNADFRDNFKKGDIDPQANYVFILKYSGSTMDRDAAGFMPRGGQFGYIFTKDFQGDAEILQTVAHELGHGKLLLKHTFDKDYGIAQGTTDNLMDYAKGKTHLAKWQWDVLADPGIAQGVFDKDEDGMSRLYTVDIDKEIEKELTNTLTSLRADPGIFSKVYNTLVQSDHIFKVSIMNLDDPELYKGGNNIIGGYFRQGSCKVEFDQENWTWNFQIIYPGTEKTPHNIVFQPEINVDGETLLLSFINNKGTVFEEFFHAGQRLYYASRRIVSLYEKEVEVEVAKAFEYYCKGWIDEYKELPMVKLNRYNLLGYSQIKAYFNALINKTEITQTMESQFREAVKVWGKDVIAKDYQERINAIDVTNYKGATDYFDYLTKE